MLSAHAQNVERETWRGYTQKVLRAREARLRIFYIFEERYGSLRSYMLFNTNIIPII